MVLQVKRNENAPPKSFNPHTSVKSIASRLRSSIHDPSRRRRARTAHGAKGKNKSKSAATVQFQVTSVSAPPTADVEMQDVETPSLTTKTYRLPKDLLRPPFQEISTETLFSVEPELGVDAPDIEYIRDVMEDIGTGLLRAVVSTVADPPKDALPAEITITVTDHSDFPPPTHMLAIHGRAAKEAPSTSRRQVTLVPAHSVVLALHCARLPKLTPSPSPPAYTSDSEGCNQLVVPVQPLCLPSPATFSLLSSFLYTKRADHLLKALLPCAPPPTLDDDRSKLPAFAGRLAGTYTAQALLLHVNSVHGLWQNACVLGVYVDELWDAIDLAWEVLLTAMAISQGMPHLMLRRPSSPPPSTSSAAPDSAASTPTA
ncbi:hypothetical protein DFH08DRAFT_1027093 [Mycena albidolilacea]|uniref:Clp1-like protein n=1 Tax=Mycena albidolilacea TaxID=1033008 RepID=A0AAD6ZJM8_9AGAR|nr:hypothetical protein DFH08DRAFT_1027093 [Mycena albidolilacea]